MKLKFSFLLSMLFVVSNVWSQDIPDWAMKYPMMSRLYTTGQFSELPNPDANLNYQNPNTTTRVVTVNGQTFVLPPNVRPFPSTATQSEVEVANMWGVDNTMFASWNSFQSPTFYGTGFCFTSNSGSSWSGSHTMFSPNSGDPGPVIWASGSPWSGRLGISVISGFGYSNNNGSSWTYAMGFPGAATFDKNFSAVDNGTCSPYAGRCYTVWTNFSGTYIYRIMISYSTDGGITWSNATPVSPVPTSGHHHQGCDVKVDRDGNVHVIWANCTSNGQNSTEDYLAYARSTNGGVSWAYVNDFAADMNGIRASNLFNGIRANGFPRLGVDVFGGARNGWLYAVTAEKNFAPAGDVADIVCMTSSNNGVNWSRVKVNQDASNGRYNYMPAVTVTPDGAVQVSYYDQRNTSGYVTQFYMSRSTNGGTAWADVQVSDHNFTPAPIPGLAGGYQGDYTGISYAGGKVWPFWADNSSGIYQVWTDGITTGYTPPPPPVNEVIVGPFLSLPGTFTVGTPATIKARVRNGGSAGQTSLPIRFSVNGVLQTTNTVPSLPAGATDSSAFSWNPPSTGSFTLRIFSGAAVDQNRCNDTVATVVTVSPSGTQTCNQQIQRGGINVYLPDNVTVKDSMVISIANSFNLLDVNCRIDTFTHTWMADVAMSLGHLGTNVPLISNRGSSGDNMIMTMFNDSASIAIGSGTPPFNGSFRPESPLSALNGLQTNGSYVLTMTDNATGDTGQLRRWTLQLTYQCIIGGIQTTEIPNYYSLAQNYPNPFNPTTQITYTLPKSGVVKLVIYDVLGREVRTLVNERKEVGVYDVNFDASALASGIYFYKLEANDFSDVKKMILVK